jgi:2-dehydro-3-deoxyphosphooctonate aldolase (KDO 8-P synthase)
MTHPLFQKIPFLKVGPQSNFLLIAGPCVVESREVLSETAARLKAICENLDIPLIFKSSYRKANRTSLSSFTGIGDLEGLKLLEEIRNQYELPVITDVHETSEVELASKFVDVLQIPAFLSRQTELISAAASTNKPVNIKKGQFLSPESMKFAIEKARSAGNENVMVTERGSTFGYGDLVVDFRGIPVMKSFGVPVILDITHSLQVPNQSTGVTGGKPELIGTIARAGIAAGVDGIFLETHPEPAKALSDGANMIRLDKVESLLKQLVALQKTLRTFHDEA